MLKLGKLPARPGAVRFRLSDYLTSALPTPPHRYGHELLERADWGMLGNDNWGDCVWAGAAHETMLWNAEAKRPVQFTDSAVLSDYSAVTGFRPGDPSTDQGTDMQVAASYRRKTGVIDASGTRHKVAAYLALKPGNEDELRLAIYLFSNLGIGITVPSSALDQFDAGKPWTIQRRSPLEGGHYVPAVGYDGHYVHVVTWGRVQKMTWGFFRLYCDEVLVYLSEEMLTAGTSVDGFQLAQLQVDLSRLT